MKTQLKIGGLELVNFYVKLFTFAGQYHHSV